MYTHKYISRHAQKHTYTLKASNFTCNVVQLDSELCPVHWSLITYFMKNGVSSKAKNVDNDDKTGISWFYLSSTYQI